MDLRIEQVSLTAGETVGLAVATSDSDPGILFVVAGDHRAMLEIAVIIAATGEPVNVTDVPDWAIVARLVVPRLLGIQSIRHDLGHRPPPPE